MKRTHTGHFVCLLNKTFLLSALFIWMIFLQWHIVTASKISFHRIGNFCNSLSTSLSFCILILESAGKTAFSFLPHVFTALMFKRLPFRLFLSHKVNRFNCCCDRVRDLPRFLRLQLGYNNIMSIPETFTQALQHLQAFPQTVLKTKASSTVKLLKNLFSWECLFVYMKVTVHEQHISQKTQDP